MAGAKCLTGAFLKRTFLPPTLGNTWKAEWNKVFFSQVMIDPPVRKPHEGLQQVLMAQEMEIIMKTHNLVYVISQGGQIVGCFL